MRGSKRDGQLEEEMDVVMRNWEHRFSDFMYDNPPLYLCIPFCGLLLMWNYTGIRAVDSMSVHQCVLNLLLQSAYSSRYHVSTQVLETLSLKCNLFF